QRSSVLFPDPLAPMMTTFSPVRTVRSTSRSTSWAPNRLTTPRSSTMAELAAVVSPDAAAGSPAAAPVISPGRAGRPPAPGGGEAVPRGRAGRRREDRRDHEPSAAGRPGAGAGEGSRPALRGQARLGRAVALREGGVERQLGDRRARVERGRELHRVREILGLEDAGQLS